MVNYKKAEDLDENVVDKLNRNKYKDILSNRKCF